MIKLFHLSFAIYHLPLKKMEIGKWKLENANPQGGER